MDKNLKNLLLSLDLNEIEIDDLENIEPMFIGLTIEEFVENCKVMIDFGYPHLQSFQKLVMTLNQL